MIHSGGTVWSPIGTRIAYICEDAVPVPKQCYRKTLERMTSLGLVEEVGTFADREWILPDKKDPTSFMRRD